MLKHLPNDKNPLYRFTDFSPIVLSTLLEAPANGREFYPAEWRASVDAQIADLIKVTRREAIESACEGSGHHPHWKHDFLNDIIIMNYQNAPSWMFTEGIIAMGDDSSPAHFRMIEDPDEALTGTARREAFRYGHPDLYTIDQHMIQLGLNRIMEAATVDKKTTVPGLTARNRESIIHSYIEKDTGMLDVVDMQNILEIACFDQVRYA